MAAAANEPTQDRDPGPTPAFLQQLQLTEDTAVPGRYHVDVSPRWNCPVVPHGGLMASVAARAMGLELAGDDGVDMRLRSLTTVFAAPVPAGPVTVDVQILRRGRSMSQVSATAREPDASAGHTTLAVFGRPRPGFEFTDLTPPDVPGPDDCPAFNDVPDDVEWDRDRPVFAFWEMVEGRAALGHAPWEDYVPTTSDTASWHRFVEPPIEADGALDPLALVTLCDTMPGSVGERMGPGGPWWYPPSADLTVHLLGEARSEWILAHKRARHCGDGYASVELALWDPEAGLVAHASQVMFFTFPDGPPSELERIPVDLRDTR